MRCNCGRLLAFCDLLSHERAAVHCDGFLRSALLWLPHACADWLCHGPLEESLLFFAIVLVPVRSGCFSSLNLMACRNCRIRLGTSLMASRLWVLVALPGSLTRGTQFTPLKTIAILLQGSRASWRHARLLLTVVVSFLLTAYHRQCWARARLVRSDCRVVDECVLTYAAAELEVAPGGAFLLSTRFRSALTLRASRTRCVTKSYASPQFRWSAGAYFSADQSSVFETRH